MNAWVLNAWVLDACLSLITPNPISSKSCWLYPQNIFRNVATPHHFHCWLSDISDHYLFILLLRPLNWSPASTLIPLRLFCLAAREILLRCKIWPHLSIYAPLSALTTNPRNLSCCSQFIPVLIYLMPLALTVPLLNAPYQGSYILHLPLILL